MYGGARLRWSMYVQTPTPAALCVIGASSQVCTYSSIPAIYTDGHEKPLIAAVLAGR